MILFFSTLLKNNYKIQIFRDFSNFLPKIQQKFNKNSTKIQQKACKNQPNSTSFSNQPQKSFISFFRPNLYKSQKDHKN